MKDFCVEKREEIFEIQRKKGRLMTREEVRGYRMLSAEDPIFKRSKEASSSKIRKTLSFLYPSFAAC